MFWRIILPLSWPGVLSGCIMVFLLSVSAFVTPQLLGGPSGIMYGNVIASQFLANNNWAFGSALSLTLVGIVLLLLLVSCPLLLGGLKFCSIIFWRCNRT